MNRIHRLLFPLFLAVVACGGDEKDGGNTDAATTDSITDTVDETDDVVAVDIVAADGGTVAVGEATLDIPPGSLATDTTVTASTTAPDASLPEFDSIVGLVYDFGPDGTTFDPAATLELPLPVTLAADESAVMSWLDTGTNSWIDLPSTVGGGVVSAPVEHFTRFVIRIVVNGVVNTGVCEWDGPCGGDIVGTWTLDGFCIYDGASTTTTTDLPPCLALVVDASVDGTITYNADGTSTSDLHIVGTFDLVFTDECIGGIADCSDLDGADLGVCTGDVAVSCTCSQQVDEYNTDTGRWTTSGNLLTTDELETGTETDSGPTTSEYCATSSTLQVYDPAGGSVVSASK